MIVYVNEVNTFMTKDIFISYKNDGCGNQFASRLAKDLEGIGYSVYFNSTEERGESFPERLRAAIASCKDFILVLSPGCVDQLMRGNTIDWVREELLTAKKYGKHIIPILVNNAEMPESPDLMPETLGFLPYIDALSFPEQYMKSPFSELLSVLLARQDGADSYKDVYNSSDEYSVNSYFAEIHERAESGDFEAMFALGAAYYYGLSSDGKNDASYNNEKAAYWWTKVANSNHDLRHNANSQLARMYYAGTIPREEQSYQKAFELYSSAASHDKYASIQEAFMKRIGCGCTFDYDSIIKYYDEKLDSIDDMGKMALAAFYTKYGNFQKAIEVYESMEYLSPEAEYRIGLFYKEGHMNTPPRPDYIQASYYLRNAADNNHIEAAYEFGRMCFNPSGKIRKNFKLAEKYFLIAANGGHTDAQYMLGYMFKNGHVSMDQNKAIYYFEKAKKQGNTYAALELATLYQCKAFQNFQKAFECAEIAAAHGVGEAEFILGNLLLFGRGCQPDTNRAYEMYSRAYEHGIYCALAMKNAIHK